MADISTFTDENGTTHNLKDAYAREKYFALDGGTPIPSGNDLNDYKTPGNYTCANAQRAGELVNCPIQSAFRMVVMRVISDMNSGRYYQLLFPNVSNSSPRIFIRRYTGTWSPWQVISPTISDLDGVVGIGHGGTGETTAAAAAEALINGIEIVSSNTTPGDNDLVIVQPITMSGYTAILGSPVRRTLLNMWDYIERKILRSTVLGVSAPTSPIWVRGAISSTTGKATSATTRLRTNAFYPVPVANGLTIDVPEGFKLYVMGYSKADEDSYSDDLSNGWVTGTFSLSSFGNSKFARFVIAKTGDGTITVAGAPELSFYSVTPTDSTVSEPNKAADAWAVANILGLSKEFDNVARKSYTVGSCFVIGAQLYRVTAAVSAGDNFVEGTNVVATNTLAEIERANSVFGVGDSYAPSGAYVVAGFCTSSTMGFSIVLPKNIGSQVSGVTVNTLKIRVCTSAGYLSGYGSGNGTSVTGTGYTVTASKRADNVVHIGVNHLDFSSISGGQALTIYIGSMDLSFT